MKYFDYSQHSKTYSNLGITGTYFIAFKDIPNVISKYIEGKESLDYGCGTGRSTRFLKKLGFNVVGVDISKEMINEAKKEDPQGKYFIIESGNLNKFKSDTFDLIFIGFVFDSIYSKDEMIKIMKELRRIIKKDGIIINITSTPELYINNNWKSFYTTFPNNIKAKKGDIVKISIKGADIIAEDYLWEDQDYREIFLKSGLKLLETIKPISNEKEFENFDESKIPPWFIYILKKEY